MTSRFRNYPAITWENLAIAEADDRRAEHRRHLSNATPDLAQRVIDLSFAYPNLSGGVVTGLAVSGVDALTPEAELVNDRNESLTAAGLNVPPERRGFWDVGLGRQIKGITRGAMTL